MADHLPRFASLRSQAEIDADVRRERREALILSGARIAIVLGSAWVLFLIVVMVGLIGDGAVTLGDLIGAAPVDPFGSAKAP